MVAEAEADTVKVKKVSKPNGFFNGNGGSNSNNNNTNNNNNGNGGGSGSSGNNYIRTN